jgi:hypothetical protein
MRGPQDTISQRQLVYRLALAIDTALLGEKVGQPAPREVEELLAANPRSALSTHVMHNIGARRARWLRAFSAARRAGALPVRSDTR